MADLGAGKRSTPPAPRGVMTASFDPHRFRSTVPYHLHYRVPYPDRLIACVAEHCALAPGGRVLDLDCGPGQLTIAVARRGATVTAIDPEPNMLAAARANPAEAGVAVTTIEGSSHDLDPALGTFWLVTLGRSFHALALKGCRLAGSGAQATGSKVADPGSETQRRGGDRAVPGTHPKG